MELIILFVLIIIVLLVLHYKQSDDTILSEAFVDNIYLTSCPADYKTYHDTNGDVLCCDGEIVANRCISDKKCTLNPSDGKIMSCVSLIMNEYSEKSKNQCPPSMQSYFEDRPTNKKGCTSGKLNNTLTGPNTDTQPICMIYPSLEENLNAKNSCHNQKKLDEIPAFGKNFTKEIIQPDPNSPSMIEIGFTDSSGIHHTAYTRASMENYLNTTNSNWRNQGIDLNKNISVAEVAKAFYIDKTLSQQEVQL